MRFRFYFHRSPFPVHFTAVFLFPFPHLNFFFSLGDAIFFLYPRSPFLPILYFNLAVMEVFFHSRGFQGYTRCLFYRSIFPANRALERTGAKLLSGRDECVFRAGVKQTDRQTNSKWTCWVCLHIHTHRPLHLVFMPEVYVRCVALVACR